jgi:hypothetical protein
MTDILALYRGRTVAEAQLVAITAESSIVDRFLRELVGEAEETAEQEAERGPLRVVERDED